jgi:hypothetical protein
MKKILTILLLLFTTSIFAKGEIIEDFQVVVPVNLNIKLGEHLRGWFEIQPRIQENASELDVAIIRPGIGWQLNKNWTVWAGYLMQANRNRVQDNYSIENRSWQGLTYQKTFGNNVFEVRNRLEQRFLPANGNMSNRWRTRFRNEYIFPDQTTWSIIAGEEVFVNLDTNEVDPSHQLQSGVSQNRANVGIGYRFNPQFQVDTGYLNQVFLNFGDHADSMNHSWITNFNLNF